MKLENNKKIRNILLSSMAICMIGVITSMVIVIFNPLLDKCEQTQYLLWFMFFAICNTVCTILLRRA